MFMIAQLAGSYFHVLFAVVVDHPRVLCEEQSIVTGMSGIHLEPCSEAIAAGDGMEALQFVKVSFACPMFAFSLYGASRSWAACAGRPDSQHGGSRHMCGDALRLCSIFVPVWRARYIVGVPAGARSPWSLSSSSEFGCHMLGIIA
jgi:hypothetical protein